MSLFDISSSSLKEVREKPFSFQYLFKTSCRMHENTLEFALTENVSFQKLPVLVLENVKNYVDKRQQ